jgi:predicted nucleic-acid-binding Zn-ribbon protein
VRSTLTCPDCGHDRIWNVRTMRERGEKNLPQDMAVAFSITPALAPVLIRPLFRSYGKFEILVCAQCGHTEWYARDFTPDGDANVTPIEAQQHGPRNCRECEQRRFWYIARTSERDANGDPTDLRVVRKGFPKLWWEGRFSTYVCRGCGWTAWYAHELGALDVDLTAGVGVNDDGTPCRDCAGHRHWHVETMHETGDAYVTALHVMMRMTFWYARTVGKFSTDICRRCGLTEWRARELQELEHDPKRGVALLERARSVSGGPYR